MSISVSIADHSCVNVPLSIKVVVFSLSGLKTPIIGLKAPVATEEAK